MASFNFDSSRGHEVVILDFKHTPESEIHWIEIEGFGNTGTAKKREITLSPKCWYNTG